MDNAIKRAFFIFPLIVIAISAYLAAGATNNIIRVYLQEKLGKGTTIANNHKPSAKPPKKTLHKKNAVSLTMNPITGEPIEDDSGFEMPEDNVQTEEAAAALDQSSGNDLVAMANKIDCGHGLFDGTPCEPAPDKYGFLIGTLVSTNPEESSARVLKDNKSRSYEIGDTLISSSSTASLADSGISSGPVVVKICRRKMYIRDQGKLLCLTSQADSKKLSQRATRTKTESPPEGEGINKVSDNEYRISRDELDHALSNLDQLATKARMVPHFKGGKTVGFRIYAIKPGSLFSKIGLKNGDIIRRINGMELNSAEKALEIYTKLKDSEHISIDITRRGKPTTIEYFIQ